MNARLEGTLITLAPYLTNLTALEQTLLLTLASLHGVAFAVEVLMAAGGGL